MTDCEKSVEELENIIWGEPPIRSHVVLTCHNARKKPLCQLTAEEIRCLIGQRVGLRYVLPLGVSLLKQDPLTAVTFFPGDLLLTLLRLERRDFAENPDALESFLSILRENSDAIAACEEIPDALPRRWI